MSLTARILLRAGPSAEASPEQLRAEYNVHLGQARMFMRKALEAEEAGSPTAHTLFLKAQIEQNAAALCAQQSSMIMLAILIDLITDDEEDGSQTEGSAVQ